MFGLYGKLKTHPGQRDALLELFLNATDSLLEMEGCYLYAINTSTSDPDGLWIYEVWRSRKDHQASLEQEAIRRLIQAAAPLLAESPQASELTPVGGVGIPMD